MYIISKFRDYYDTAATYGIDKTCVYERTEKVIPYRLEEAHSRVLREHSSWFDDGLICGVIGFCGQLYPVANTPNAEPTIYYAKTEVPEAAQKTFRSYLYGPNIDFWDAGEWSCLKPIFQDHKAPVFLIQKNSRKVELVLNPCLKPFEFYRIKPSAQAFQEIFQYISGVLGVSTNPMASISDKKMAEKKGFDERSFKKDPGGKKRGKKK